MKSKKRFGKLSKPAQKKVESEYHGMKAEEFKDLMSTARLHTPAVIRLPEKLVETLKTLAQSAGELRYQTMVKRWIEERLRQEAKTVL
ncbi:MAG TPA: hypothetical protein VK210_03520 [Terriglobia bacterium]|nr:hypothetical protein [Terriglobia bacterium]